MQCLRCGGLLAAHTFSDGNIDATTAGWRCLQCGARSDPGIEANQKNRHRSEARTFTKERRMRPNETELARRDQTYVEMERTLRAMDRLPWNTRMTRLRDLAAGRVTVHLPPDPAPTKSITSREQKRGTGEMRRQQLKRLSQRFWLSRHASTTLRKFVNDRIANNRRHVLRVSASCERLSPLQQIVWNIAPFFIHRRRNFNGQPGQIAWEELVQFLYLSQSTGTEAHKGRGSTKIVNPTSHLRNEANRLRVIYQQIHSKAPGTPYATQITSLLSRHSRTLSTD
jgi:hypothetical protein